VRTWPLSESSGLTQSTIVYSGGGTLLVVLVGLVLVLVVLVVLTSTRTTRTYIPLIDLIVIALYRE